LPPLAISYAPIESLKPNAGNPRQHSAKQIEQIARSIETFGFNVPLLTSGGNVVAGHGRLAAAIRLGLKAVPTISLDHLSEPQRRAFMVADNRLAEISAWNETLLRDLFLELSAADVGFDLEVTGFDLPAIDFMLQGEAPSQLDQDPGDAAIEEGSAVSRRGDVWQLGDHRVVCGSALDPAAYEVLMGGERAAMVWSDPPYNVSIRGHVSGHGKKVHREFLQASGEMSRRDFVDFLRSSYRQLARNSVEGAIHYICSDWRHAAEFLEASEGIYSNVLNCCVWNKGSGALGSFYRSQHEWVWVFKSGKAPHINNVQLGRYGRTRTNVWDYAGINSFARSTDEGNLLDLHPTVKPVQMVADAILDASNRGDIVLDAFLGSGTTIIAAERTGRIGRGIELDPGYVDVAVRRWQRLTKRAAVHATLQCTFDELEEVRLGGSYG
jgi:DNA modification methylase